MPNSIKRFEECAILSIIISFITTTQIITATQSDQVMIFTYVIGLALVFLVGIFLVFQVTRHHSRNFSWVLLALVLGYWIYRIGNSTVTLQLGLIGALDVIMRSLELYCIYLLTVKESQEWLMNI